ncbi:endopeptidase La [Clostridium botulinum]|uniref:Lon protease n=1 Tax=Clostridium botulinum (strain Eklund 17B / Type B) TaxID=935198 RepID=B2TPB7_CLOBB|nr:MULTISPECIES: endopeptidase La [unclassified Clostridium]ACD23304.1 ATP-dependent protease La [Clostridium botulinum B str. Eklund 17B (NRP)]MBN1053014.1 endopeptidase La [Clostridium botulinum]MBN1056221.1 endopeptidase La [Clostridium botulinum]MBY6975257.1 endopeptidase La [Clostridium botulinum]MBY7000806.1 endopeptidase La [Clostridium botulinum]
MTQNLYTLPLIPLRGLTIFPNIVAHFDVGRKRSIAAIEEAMLNNEEIFLVTQKDPEIEDPEREDIYDIGTLCKIKQILKMSDNTIKVLVEGVKRGKIVEYIADDNEYIEGSIEFIEQEIEINEELEAYIKLLDEDFIELLKISDDNYVDIIRSTEPLDDPSGFVDIIASYSVTEDDIKQEVLETIDIKKRIEIVLSRVKIETDILKIQNKLSKKVKKHIDEEQKQFYLREQLKAIQEELGMDDEEKKEINKYETLLNKTKLPKQVKEKVQYELSRLKSTSSSSSEGNLIKSYLDWVFNIPWNKQTKENIDIIKAREVLDNEHYGLEDVKDRIVEYLAVKQISKNSKGPILCLVGPPGVGKTSIAKSIAHSTNRKYSRISLGGMKDEAEIRGHRKTYVGAIPGRIAYALKEAKTMNPLILFDEIDKISSSYKGEPSDALLEVLDSEQNKTFRDNYLELDMDLSKVMFIATANSLETIPRALLDRMEIIEVSGYTYEEKFNIAKNHLIPKVFEEIGIKFDKVEFEEEAINEIIEGYTRESGVRGLTRNLNSIIRKALAEMLSENLSNIIIDKSKVEKLLGKRKYEFDKIDKEDKIGVVTGMAWTAYGGDTLPVEVMAMKGSGKLELTGKLGDVMKESAKAAYSYVRANADKFQIEENFYKNKDIHIHAPEGAVPKDGPSAGVTMVTALVSALSGKKVKHNIAMTGEVTLTGRVLPIGGLKEKSLAAFRAGIDTIIIPKENEKDIEKIPNSIKNKLNIIPVSQVNEVLKNALIGEDTNEN